MLGKLFCVVVTMLLLPTQILAASSWHGGSHRAWHSHHSQNLQASRHHRHGTLHPRNNMW